MSRVTSAKLLWDSHIRFILCASANGQVFCKHACSRCYTLLPEAHVWIVTLLKNDAFLRYGAFAFFTPFDDTAANQ